MKSTAISFGYFAVFVIIKVFGMNSEPEFAASIPSLQIIAGRDAELKCVVDNLGDYKVAWMNIDKQTLLSINTHVITRDERISVTNPNSRTWHLQLKNVIPEDSGYYMCQINTQPMISQAGHLNVVVPPEFAANMTNRNITVTENSNVTISCRATGNPEPVVTWKREDAQPFFINGEQVKQYTGAELAIVGVTRQHMAAYLCVASNQIPPPISRRIYLDVTFPPLIWIQNQLVGAAEGTNVSLECHTEAHPASKNEWLRDGDQSLPKNERYKTYLSTNSYKVHMKLAIKRLSSEDYGSYRCVVSNTLGQREGSITLYKLKIPTPKPEAAYVEFIPTKPPAKTTVMVTIDQRDVVDHTAEVERRDKSFYPGFQQKYGDGRSVPKPENCSPRPCSFQWIVFLIIIRTVLFLHHR